MIRAAAEIHRQSLAEPILLGDPLQIAHLVSDLAIDWPPLTIIDPATATRRECYRERLVALRAPRPTPSAKSHTEIDQPLNFAALMIREGDADGCVAGCVSTSAAVMRAALRYVGRHPDQPLVSSFFIMRLQDHHPVQDVLLMADCALIAEPDSESLAAIAIATGHSAIELLGLEPDIAMLSFSTLRSARHPAATRVARATERARTLAPDWRIIGEVQLDAAVIPAILARKAPQLASSHPCNILIVPNLDAGNIGYKLLQRFGGATAVGPILQGLRHPVNDLSRGCSAEDIVDMVAVTAAQCRD